MQPSINLFNDWVKISCKECAGHGGGHYAGCSKRNPAAVALGALGGRSKSKKKIEASRLNGKKGGRPKKIIPS